MSRSRIEKSRWRKGSLLWRHRVRKKPEMTGNSRICFPTVFKIGCIWTGHEESPVTQWGPRKSLTIFCTSCVNRWSHLNIQGNLVNCFLHWVGRRPGVADVRAGKTHDVAGSLGTTWRSGLKTPTYAQSSYGGTRSLMFATRFINARGGYHSNGPTDCKKLLWPGYTI